MIGSTVTLPAKRFVYEVMMGGGFSNPHHHYRWQCPTGCGFSIDQCEDDPNPETAKIVAQDLADRHDCDAGWCTIPARQAGPQRTAVPAVGEKQAAGQPVSSRTQASPDARETLAVIRRKHPKAGTVGLCSGCGAPVIWLVSSHDKLTPIDPAPVAKGNVVVDLEHGVWVHAATRPEATERHVVHFVTCPKAAEFRRA